MRIEGWRLAVSAEGLAWRSTDVEGVDWLPLHLGGDRSGGDVTALIRMAPGRGYPAHRHRGIEEVLVLAGGYRDADGEYRAGDYVRYEPGTAHAPVALGDAAREVSDDNPACVLYAVSREGVELLRDAPEDA